MNEVMKKVPISNLFVFLLTSLALISCGGGDSNSGGQTPALSLTPQSVKTFHFSWEKIAGVTEYRLLEDPDSVSGYTQVATLDADATSHDLTVSLPKRVNARYILQACSSTKCSDSAPVSVNGSLAEAIGYVKASNTGAGDLFGYSIALSADGNTLAMGAYGERSNAIGIGGNQSDNSTRSGAAYIFIRSGNVWSQEAYIKASNTGENDAFGYSVTLSADGNTLAVSAVNEASNASGIGGDQADDSAPSAGAVYVFTRSGSTWSQEAYVKASNTGANDNFGFSLSLSANGNTLAVGAYGEDSNAMGIGGDQANNSASAAGAVYIFTRDSGTWSQNSYVKASNTKAGEWFGYSVVLSADGNTLAVGAYGEASNATGINGDQANDTAPFAGAVYVFTRSGSAWSQEAYVKASNTRTDDRFGVSVVLSDNGNTLAAGAEGERSNATGVNGNQADDSAPYAGAVYVFSRSSNTWNQESYLKASNTWASGLFGYSVALSADGNTLAVGARSEHSNATGIGGNQAGNQPSNSALYAGAIYLFSRSNSAWSQQAYVKASNTQAYDDFGYSVALSADGNTLAVGAYEEDSSATGIGGDQLDDLMSSSGAVYLY